MQEPTLQRTLQMVDVLGQYHRYQDEIDSAIHDVVQSGAYINGPAVRTFEKSMANCLGVKHAIGCASGTDALQIALMAYGIGAGDEVITTTFTFVATTETIALLGARPVYVDIDPRTFNIDVTQIEAKITKRTKAIIPVHLFGQPCDITAIQEIAARHSIPVIEDAAQAVGAKWNGTRVCGIGEIAAISFYPSKNLGAFGDGGMITTNDDALAEQMRSIANHGSSKTYQHVRLGVNSRLDSIQGAILNVKLRYLDEWNAARSQAAESYTNYFAPHPELLTTPYVDPRAEPIWHQYSLIVKGDRAKIGEFLRASGVPFNIYYPVPLHLQPAYSGYGNKPGEFPVAEFAAEHILALPMHSELKQEDIEYISTQVLEAVQRTLPG